VTGKTTKGLSWLKTVTYFSAAFFGFKALFGLAQPDPGKVIAEALMTFLGTFLMIGIPAFVLGWLTGENNAISTPSVVDEVLPLPFLDTQPKPQRANSESAAAAPKVFTFRNEHENSEPKLSPAKSPSGRGARLPQMPPVGSIPDEAFAEALTEIEESRTVKGLWARCFAETDGDEVRTKAAYLSKRAEALAAEFNHRIYLEAQADRRAKELAPLLAGESAGDQNALFKLGTLYHSQNELVEVNHEKAIACISKAAFLGNTEAQIQLSMMYWIGDIVPMSKCDALAWRRCAGISDYGARVVASQWMTQIDSPEVTKSDAILASIISVKDSTNNLEGAIAAFKTRNLSLANSSSTS
jgi:hypothetical protein